MAIRLVLEDTLTLTLALALTLTLTLSRSNGRGDRNSQSTTGFYKTHDTNYH